MAATSPPSFSKIGNILRNLGKTLQFVKTKASAHLLNRSIHIRKILYVAVMRPRPEFQKRCQEVAWRINARLAVIKPAARKLKEIGTSADALRKQNVARYVTLAELAEVLETTPNWLLGITENHEAVIGLLEAISLSHGMNLSQAKLLAEATAAVLDSPALSQSGLPLREAARQGGLLLIEQARAGLPSSRRKEKSP